MKNKKLSGSFYTPKVIADFMVEYLSEKMEGRESVSILEPSAGDGIFVRTVLENPSFKKAIRKVVAVEQSKRELNKVINCVEDKRFVPIYGDFLDYQDHAKSKFSLVIGNPPYVRSGLLEKRQIKLCSEIHSCAGLSSNKPKNIWTAFLVRCVEFTDNEGILAFVLPAEFLQVKFAAELREFIVKSFERVEIFTFSELLFEDCKGQDTVLLIAERQSTNKGVYYCNIDKIHELDQRNFTLTQNIKILESKWNHHHLDSEALELLEKLNKQLHRVDHYCASKAGIVTAANDFFIVNKELIDEYSLSDYVQPIIQRGVYVNGSVEVDNNEFQKIVNSKPAYLLALNRDSVIRTNARLWNYLEQGKERNLHKRFKTKLRENWYEVPNVGIAPEAFFFKRCDEYPKLLKNTAAVLATDSAYIINMREAYEIEKLIYSFYNSLTLCFAEMRGRSYGGGVLELTPNEFKSLPVPYYRNRVDFPTYVTGFKNKSSIKEVCDMNDLILLKAVDPQLDNDSIVKLGLIREKLYLRRIKNG